MSNIKKKEDKLEIEVGKYSYDYGSRVDDVALIELDNKLRKCESDLKKIINEIEELQKDNIVLTSEKKKVKKSTKKKKN